MSDPARPPQPEIQEREPLQRFPWWLRLLSRLPFAVLYALADFLAFLAEYVVRHRRAVIDMQLKRCFPELDAAGLTRLRRAYYRNFADVVVESLKAITIEADELRSRFELRGFDLLREQVDAGHTVILTTSHNCNWEWTLQIVSLELGRPLDAAYKPLHQAWSDRLFLGIRSRFGAQMVPAKRLLKHVLRRRKEPRVVAMVADQDPVSAAVRYFTTFFGQDTAFYQGPEMLARAVQGSIVFVAPRRIGRGRYAVDFELLVAHDEQLPPGAMTERYVRRVEALIREHPSDWLWSYRRWKLRRNARGQVTRGTGMDPG
jgi:Kdo2-lipid IVA lauroyltransferase/acyltransferase